MTYSEKLRDPRWQKMRLEILERDKFTCKRCRSTGKTLHVHHAFYEKGKAPWEYDGEFLLTLCHECHEVAESERLMVLKAMANPVMASMFANMAKTREIGRLFPVAHILNGLMGVSNALASCNRVLTDGSEDEFEDFNTQKELLQDAISDFHRFFFDEEDRLYPPEK